MTTAKMNKEQMVQFLDEHFKEVTDKNLQERITYTANAWKKTPDSVKLSDLRPLVKEVEALLPKEESKPAPANSTKKTLKKSSKQEEPKTEETAPVEEKTEKKAPAKKPVAKKSEKKPAVKPSDTVKGIEIADYFSDVIETEIGTLEKAQDIKTFADLRNALASEQEIYFAVYWSKRLIKQFGYSNIESIKSPKSFANDLDLVSCIYIGDEDTVAVGISAYTDAPYTFQPKDLITDEESGLRYVNGAEFELYRLTDAVE